MSQNVDETLEDSFVEFFLYRASTYNSQEVWAAFRQSLEETVLTWFHLHPLSEAVCRVQSDKHIVTLAFERLWQAVVQGLVACETLSEVLVYLCASLNGVILEALRDSSRPGAVLSPWSDAEDSRDRSAVWDKLQTLLSNERERRLAYLLYHCGLKPAEIVRRCPNEWSDISEVIRLRCIIVERLMKGPMYEGHTFV